MFAAGCFLELLCCIGVKTKEIYCSCQKKLKKSSGKLAVKYKIVEWLEANITYFLWIPLFCLNWSVYNGLSQLLIIKISECIKFTIIQHIENSKSAIPEHTVRQAEICRNLKNKIHFHFLSTIHSKMAKAT